MNLPPAKTPDHGLEHEGRTSVTIPALTNCELIALLALVPRIAWAFKHSLRHYHDRSTLARTVEPVPSSFTTAMAMTMPIKSVGGDRAVDDERI